VSKKAMSIGYIIAVSVSMVLAMNGIIQFFGGNAFTLASNEQKSAFSVIDKLLDQNAVIIAQNKILIGNLDKIGDLDNLSKRIDVLDQKVSSIFQSL
jgi:hypothetical protein